MKPPKKQRKRVGSEMLAYLTVCKTATAIDDERWLRDEQKQRML